MDSADRLRSLSRTPVWAAPMAGGPSTPALVAAVARAGALGFLAAGYKTADAMRAEMEALRAAGVRAYGVNVFVPGSPSEPEAVHDYLATLAPEAARLGTGVGEPSWDDDHWADKASALLADPPPVASFTFGCPPGDLVAGLRARGAMVLVTVTSPEEAALATAAGAEALCVQGPGAGGHRGTFANGEPPGEGPGGMGGGAGETGGGADLLGAVEEIAAVCGLPLVAAGGLSGPEDVARTLASGVVAVQLGTAFLRCPESGASPVHKAALADPRFTGTAVTRAFSGRPARALVNQFMLDHPQAPAAYPEINNATRPLRAAAAAAGDTGRMSLYAGTGFRSASERPAGEVVAMLAEAVR